MDLKRLLAYSSIAHAGYILIGIVAGTPEAVARSRRSHTARYLRPALGRRPRGRRPFWL